jgi:hypothetical protein
MRPTDSLDSYLASLSSLRDSFSSEGWVLSWPESRLAWAFPGFLKRQVFSIAALLLAIVTPILALRAGLRSKGTAAFGLIVSLTFMGACATAALADNPLTRIEILPFRGIKLAFIVAWFGAFLSLYSWVELKDQLLRPVRRLDIAVGLAGAAVIAYVLIRMGNASAAWKPGMEQTIRDHLEALLIARPRFKEFAVGYPLLILGLHLRSHTRIKSFWEDGRFLIGFGMIGPISMVNTFCHLHSPLYLAIWRSVNGILFGTVLGLMLVSVKKRAVKLL